jgi:heme/copper-type cytochrome/quinol oxidase subunit 3
MEWPAIDGDSPVNETTFVQGNLRLGFMLFIISEVMFFASFFWAFFHSSIDPSIWVGSIWPPEGIVNFFISEDISSLSSLSAFASISETFFTAASALVFGDFYLLFNNVDLWSIPPVEPYIYGSKKTDSFIDFLGITWYLSDTPQQTTFTKSKMNLVREVDFYDSFKLPFASVFSYIIEKNNPVNLANSLNSDLNYVSSENISIFADIDFKNIHTTSLNLNLYDSGSLINPYSLPLINTFILLTSGAFLTWSHKSLRIESFREAVWSLNAVIFFAWAFMTVQFHEYLFSALSINDGIFGSTFFMLTGFHGIHVIIGSIFLIVCIFRFLLIHFTRSHHFGYEAAIWYWHFVDVVWVFLYLFVYFWPSNFFFWLFI